MILRTLITLCLIGLALNLWADEQVGPAQEESEKAAHQEWMRSQYRHLARIGPPAVQASVLTSPVLSVDGALSGEFEETFLRLLRTDDLDPPTLWNLAYVCRRPAYQHVCIQHQVRERLIASDPENAAVHLLPPFTSTQNGDEKPRLTRQDLLAAANSSRFDGYFASVTYQVYELALESVIDDPSPAGELHEPIPWQAAAIAIASMYSLPSYVGIFDHCEQAWQDSDSEILGACGRLAAILKAHSRSLFAANMGSAFERRLLMLADPDSNRALELYRQQRLRTHVLTCLSQWVWPNSLERLHTVDIGLMLKQLGELGEFAFTEQWADKRYAEHPDWSDRSPDECRAMRKLEGDALIAELGDSDPYSRWLAEGEKIRAAAAD